MSGQKQHINYTLADIEQYLQGKLSPAEMHALEKAALQDPFLADAIEGYQQSDLPLAQIHLAEIREKLLKENTTLKPIVAISRKNRQWMRIAALFILLIGAGTIGLYLFNSTGEKQELAKQSRVVSSSPLTAATPTVDTTNQSGLNNIVANPIDEKNKGDIAAKVPAQTKQENAFAKQESLLRKSEEIRSANKEVLSQLAAEKNVPDIYKKQATVSIPDQRAVIAASGTINGGTFSGTSRGEKADYITSLSGVQNVTVTGNIKLPETKDLTAGLMTLEGKAPGVNVTPSQPIRLRGMAGNTSNNSRLNVFTGRITDSAGIPVSNASVIIGNTNKGVATDKNGNFTLITADSVPEVKIASVGFETLEQQLSAKSKNEFKLNASENALSEVVVTGYGRSRKVSSAGSVSKINPEKDQSGEIKPEKGWTEFKKILAKKISDARSKNLSGVFTGTIKAELMLNRRGKATEVVIISSFNTALNETIIRAIKDGPRWLLEDGKPAKGKKQVLLAL